MRKVTKYPNTKPDHGHLLNRQMCNDSQGGSKEMGQYIISVICALACVSAFADSKLWAQASPSFDGKYAGTATQVLGHRTSADCTAIQRMEMTITGGQVAIREIDPNGRGPTYMGSVTAAGEVSASFQSKQLPTDIGSTNAFTVSGTIRDNSFTGQRVHLPNCYFNVQMVKQ